MPLGVWLKFSVGVGEEREIFSFQAALLNFCRGRMGKRKKNGCLAGSEGKERVG
jgi:hypothetical protein